ncbi:MAG TPA: PAS domain S-box protein, partial [Herpetosiphonaceae bacterium]
MPQNNDSQFSDEIKVLRNRVSELERAQDAAIAQLVLQHVRDAVIGLDSDLRIQSWNKAAEALYGWSDEEVVGQRLLDILPPIRIQNDLAMHDLVARLYQFSVWRGEMVYFNRQGRDVVVEASIHLLPSRPGSPGGLLHIHHDISEYRQLEQQKDKLQHARNRNLAESALLSIIATAAAGENSLERILSITLGQLADLIQFTGGSIALVEGDDLVIRAAFGPFAEAVLGQRLRRGPGRSWQVITTGTPYLCNDLLAVGARAPSSDSGTAMQSYLAVPLRWRGQVFGMLEVDSTKVNAFHPADMSLLQSVAAALSGPIEMARRHGAEQHALSTAETMQRRYSELVEGLEAIIWEANPATFHVTFVSQWAERLLGHSLDRWMLEPDFWPQLIHPADRERVLSEARAAVDDGGRYDLTYRVVAADGGTLWLRDRAEIVCDAAGRPERLRGMMLDITSQQRAADELHNAMRRLDFHLENSPLAIIEWDREFRVARWAESAERMFGWSAEEVAGKHFGDWEFVFEQDAERVRQVVGEMIRGGGERSVTLNRNHTKDGRVISCEWYSSVMLDERGELLSVLSQVLDVTERERLEAELKATAQANAQLYREAEQAVRARDQFLSIAAHELKTPITTILGNAQLLRRRADREGAASSRDQRALRALAEQAQRLSRLSVSLLDLSRIE